MTDTVPSPSTSAAISSNDGTEIEARIFWIAVASMTETVPSPSASPRRDVFSGSVGFSPRLTNLNPHSAAYVCAAVPL